MLEGLDTEASYRYERIAELAAQIIREEPIAVKYAALGKEQYAELACLLNEVGALGAKWLQ